MPGCEPAKRIQRADEGLSDEDLAAFERDGFVVVRGLFRRQARQLQRWASEVSSWPEHPASYAMYFEQSLGNPGARILNRVEKFAECHAGLLGILGDPSLMIRLEQLFGEPAVLFKDKINYKLPGGGGFEPHQDSQAGWEDFALDCISVLVAIDPNTLANGCVEFAAGHHANGLLGERWQPLTDEQLANVQFVPFTLAPGDAVFFSFHVPHKSAPNLTERPRRNLYLTYNCASHGDVRARYFAEKRRNFPPDVEREGGKSYSYRV